MVAMFMTIRDGVLNPEVEYRCELMRGQTRPVQSHPAIHKRVRKDQLFFELICGEAPACLIRSAYLLSTERSDSPLLKWLMVPGYLHGVLLKRTRCLVCFKS
jgi:hypothetical protein